MNNLNNYKENPQKLSKFRLTLMRGLYLLTFIGLAFEAWTSIISPEKPLDYITGVAFSFWAAYSTLMVLGVRYPVKMMPLLFLQLLYKSIWLIGVYLPMKANGPISPESTSFFWICITAVILDTIVIPWPYVYSSYMKMFFAFFAKY